MTSSDVATTSPTRLHTCSECIFEVEPGWVEDTGYVFVQGDCRVIIGRYGAASTWAGKLDRAIEAFRLSTPGYQLLERGTIDRPVPGGEMLAHRIGGSVARLEVNLFWPLGDTMWVCRVRGPWDAEELCRDIAERFLESYEPTERIEGDDE